VVGGFFYFKDNFFSRNVEHDQSNVISRASIEVVPFPMLSQSNSNQKNTLLYDMLLHKSGQDVFLQDTEVALGNLKRLFPIELEKLSLKVNYNPDKERLEFNGKSALGASLVGHCLFDNKNGILYQVELAQETQRILINLKHNSDNDDVRDYSVGEFLWEIQKKELVKLISNTEIADMEEQISVGGNFAFHGEELVFSNFTLNNEKIDLNIILKSISTSKPKLSIKIGNGFSNVDFGGIKKIISDPILIQDIVRRLNLVETNLTINTGNVHFGDMKLRNFKLDLHNQEGIIDIKHFSFGLPNGGSVFSQGTIADHKFAPEYIGILRIKGASSNDLHNLISSYTGPEKVKVDINTKVKLKPSLLIMNDVEIKEDDFLLKSKKIKAIYFNSSNSLLVGDLVLNKPLYHSKFLTHLLKEFDSKENKERWINSVDLDIILSSAKSKDIGMNYMMFPNLLRLTNMTFDKEFKGNIEIDLKRKILNGDFSGDIYGWQSLGKTIANVVDFGALGAVDHLDLESLRQLTGTVRFDAKNLDKDTAGNLKCYLDYKKGHVKLRNCYANTLGSKVNFTGDAFLQNKGIRYEIDFNGDGLSFKSLVSSGLMDTLSMSVKEVRGDFAVYGHLKSSGESLLEALKNMVSKADIGFKEATISGKLFKNDSEAEGYNTINLQKGRVEIQGDTVVSGEFSGVKELNRPSFIKFSHDFIKKAITTVIS